MATIVPSQLNAVLERALCRVERGRALDNPSTQQARGYSVRIKTHEGGGNLSHDRLLSHAALVPLISATNPRYYDRGRWFHPI